MQITRLCKEFNSLPLPGGILAQPKGYVLRLEACLDAFNKHEKDEIDAMKKA